MVFAIRFMSLAAFFLLLTGCKKEDPNPELMDPIFKDLEAKAVQFQKTYEEESARLVTLRKELGQHEARSMDLRNAKADIQKTMVKIRDSEQWAKYYRIRAERRKLVARIEYKKAFADDKAWPDPHEYVEYSTNLRLREAKLNWATRVPKLQDRLSKRAPAAEKPAAASGGHH